MRNANVTAARGTAGADSYDDDVPVGVPARCTQHIVQVSLDQAGKVARIAVVFTPRS